MFESGGAGTGRNVLLAVFRCFRCFSMKLSASDFAFAAENLDFYAIAGRNNSEPARCSFAVFCCSSTKRERRGGPWHRNYFGWLVDEVHMSLAIS